VNAVSLPVLETLHSEADELRKTVFEFYKAIDDLDSESKRMEALLIFGKIVSQVSLIGSRLNVLTITEKPDES
jgi:hypothetical protein